MMEIRKWKKDWKKKEAKWIVLMLFSFFTVAACGNQTNGDVKEEAGMLMEADTQAEVEREAEAGEKAEDKETSEPMEHMDGTFPDIEDETDTDEVETERKNAEVITVYTTEEPKYSEEEIPVLYTDDLSLLANVGQADFSYAYRDGKVYYRQYHENSFEEGALWADYKPVSGAEKEIVCIDADGEKNVLFSDRGYGEIYLIGERFYMTENAVREVDGFSSERPYIYSVDMQGQNRMDYGWGRILAFDMDRNVLILSMQPEGWEETYFALDGMSGEMTPLTFDFCDSMYLRDYYAGWCYFTAYLEEDFNICTVVAVSLEGEQREIITLASDNETVDNYGYHETICQMETDGDRIYIVFGGYAGSGHFYQGGRIITVKLDGSDYRAIDCFNDFYYVCHDAGRTLVYIPHSYRISEGKKYEATVWDVEANTYFPSNLPWQIINGQQTGSVIPYQEHMVTKPLCDVKEEGINVYALADGFGRIVRVAMQIDDRITQRGDGEADYIDYKHFYYADGFLYFEVEFNIYDQEYAIGWRDGYRRLQTDVYRLKLDGDVLELLYSY